MAMRVSMGAPGRVVKAKAKPSGKKPSKTAVSAKRKPKTSSKTKSKFKPKPSWNDSFTDLSVHKLSKAKQVLLIL